MKQLTILSGKGGTGKTTVTAAFSMLAERIVVADCDVDAPDLHMLLHPKIIETQKFKGLKLAVIDSAKCIKCGLCIEKCRFEAISDNFEVDPFSCEGCGVCVLVCPAKAVTLTEQISGYAYLSKVNNGFMAHAMLIPGAENSGKLVTLVRQNAKITAEKENINLIIIDGPPGVGCPVIASITGVDAGLIVAEPTMSGIHDLKRVLQLLDHFKVQPLVCVNMYDVNESNTEKILRFCRNNDIEVVGKIAFDPKVTEAMVNGKPVVEYSPECNAAYDIRRIWNNVSEIMTSKI
ncbi:P-loop NTPase [Candidatus Bathyarchaeota archaeon]|nr:P-loop NTPase [Candidatus Bathyarchaeota archaeon]